MHAHVERIDKEIILKLSRRQEILRKLGYLE